jgi:DNA-binding NarL/FixJ family response regulator
MASQKRKAESTSDQPVPSGLSRLTNLIALLLIKGEPQPDQVSALVRAGFSNTEIAGLLGMTPNAVNVAVHRLRRSR